MKRLLQTACAALVLLTAAAVLFSAETIEIAADSAGGVQKSATTKDLELVLPQRFFRVKGVPGFSTPYIAELHYTTDAGKTWQSYGLFKDLDKPFQFTADQEARYGFFVTLLDQKGNYDQIPEADTQAQVTVLVDWTAPEVKITSPAGGAVLGAATPAKIQWEADDSFLADSPITIEYALDGSNLWQPVAKAIDNTGTFDWTVPKDLNARVLLRVTAVDEVGHVSSAVTSSPVLVDTTAPVVRITGPGLSGSEEVPLDLEATDGDGSGIAEVRLFVSPNNGVSWAPSGKFAAGQPIVFRSATGSYGLFASAVDNAGNAAPEPQPGQAPQVVLQIDTKTPIVRLKTLLGGGFVSGGSQTPIEWEAVTPHPAERCVSIFLSPDGGNTWANVAVDIANSGLFAWDVPSINSSNCFLKITVKDAEGAIGQVQSLKPFTIDSTRPTSAIGVPPGVLSQGIGDLSRVMRPSGGAQEPGPPSPEGEAPGAAAPGPPSGLAPGVGEAVTGKPQPTEPTTAPWTGAEGKPYTGVVAPDTTVEGVLKAAFAAYKAGQLPMAKQYFQQAAKIDPADPRPHAALGKIYAAEGGFNYTSKKQSFEAALYEFDKALDLGGPNADVYNDKGYVLLIAKRFKDAEKLFRKATELGSKSCYWCNLGIALSELGRRDDAAQAFAKALEADPDMKEANFFMARISAAKGDWEGAKRYYTKAVDGYGADDDYGKLALAGIQRAREQLGEIEPEPKSGGVKRKLERLR